MSPKFKWVLSRETMKRIALIVIGILVGAVGMWVAFSAMR